MASVCEEEKCPRCGGILVSDFNCHTNEKNGLSSERKNINLL